MNTEQILKALAIADALLTAGFDAYKNAQVLIGQARAEGRDITDAELDGLRASRDAALAAFRSAHG